MKGKKTANAFFANVFMKHFIIERKKKFNIVFSLQVVNHLKIQETEMENTIK